MDKYNMKEYLETLSRMEKGIRRIAFSESEKYQFFVNEIKEIRIELADLDEENRDLIRIGEIIDRITRLQHEYDKQIKNSEELGDNSIKLGENPVSTNEVRKQNRIKLYSEIIEDLKKLPEIAIENITKIKEQWDKEKDGSLHYSEAEKEKIETLISDILLEYFIKYTKQNSELPSEVQVTEYCTMEQFEQRVVERLIQEINQKDDKIRKLQLQAIVENSDVEDMLSNGEVWKELTGVEVSLENDKNSSQTDELEQIAEELVDEVTNLPTKEQGDHQQREKRVTVKCNIKLRKLGGKEEYKTVEIELDEKGGLVIPAQYRNNIIKIDIPEEVKGIATRGFYGCKRLNNIVITKNIQYIAREAFMESAIKRISYEQESMLEEIGESAFEKTEIESMIIPRSVRIIGEKAFKGCKRFYSLAFEQNAELIEIQQEAFKDCLNLHNIVIPENVEKIGRFAFAFSRSSTIATIIKLNEKLIHINEGAFRNRNIRDVYIKKSVEFIGKDAFYTNPENIIFEEGSKIMYCDEKAFGFWDYNYELTAARVPQKCDRFVYNLSTTPSSWRIAYIKDYEELEAEKKQIEKGKNESAIAINKAIQKVQQERED